MPLNIDVLEVLPFDLSNQTTTKKKDFLDTQIEITTFGSSLKRFGTNEKLARKCAHTHDSGVHLVDKWGALAYSDYKKKLHKKINLIDSIIKNSTSKSSSPPASA